MSREELNQILREIKQGLLPLYGEQLKGVYAFGSYARGEQVPESDLDILIVLTDYYSYSAEIKRTGELISYLSLAYNVSISRKFMKEDNWVEGDTALLRSVRAEAVAI